MAQKTAKKSLEAFCAFCETSAPFAFKEKKRSIVDKHEKRHQRLSGQRDQLSFLHQDSP
jgi:hypothetical protein